MSSNEENKEHAGEKSENREEGKRCGRCCGRGWRKLLFLPLILIALAAKGAVVMWLWNYLIPDLFHGPSIDYVQALGLLVLAKLLVGFGVGFGRFGGHCHGHRHHRGWRGKWMHMSREEREKMREEFRRRFEGT